MPRLFVPVLLGNHNIQCGTCANVVNEPHFVLVTNEHENRAEASGHGPPSDEGGKHGNDRRYESENVS